MDLIKVKTIEELKEAMKTLGVSEKRIEGLDAKFVSVPDEFKVTDSITAREVVIGGETRVVPEFQVESKGIKTTIPIGQLFASHCGENPKASIITKEGSYKNRFLVVNNKKVNAFAEGLSEAEFILACLGKKFKANPAQNYPVYSGFVTEDKKSVLKFHGSAEEALKAIQPKSYRSVEIVR